MNIERVKQIIKERYGMDVESVREFDGDIYVTFVGGMALPPMSKDELNLTDDGSDMNQMFDMSIPDEVLNDMVDALGDHGQHVANPQYFMGNQSADFYAGMIASVRIVEGMMEQMPIGAVIEHMHMFMGGCAILAKQKRDSGQ